MFHIFVYVTSLFTIYIMGLINHVGEFSFLILLLLLVLLLLHISVGNLHAAD